VVECCFQRIEALSLLFCYHTRGVAVFLGCGRTVKRKIVGVVPVSVPVVSGGCGGAGREGAAAAALACGRVSVSVWIDGHGVLLPRARVDRVNRFVVVLLWGELCAACER